MYSPTLDQESRWSHRLQDNVVVVRHAGTESRPSELVVVMSAANLKNDNPSWSKESGDFDTSLQVYASGVGYGLQLTS